MRPLRLSRLVARWVDGEPVSFRQLRAALNADQPKLSGFSELRPQRLPLQINAGPVLLRAQFFALARQATDVALVLFLAYFAWSLLHLVWFMLTQ